MVLLWLLAATLLAFIVWGIVRGLRTVDVSVSGQHVIITGGSEGLGLALAQLLVANGAHVTIMARNRQKLEVRCCPSDVALPRVLTITARQEAKAAIEGKRVRPTQRVQAISVDVTSSAAVDAAVQQSVAASGPVAMLVANAGLALPRLFADQSEAELRQMMDVNFHGSVNAARAVWPLMQRARAGRIVFVGSGMCVTAFAGFAGYCASKWALRGFAEALATEAAPAGVSVHIYYAPTMDTPGLAQENVHKPAATRELEAIGSSISAVSAAQTLSRGLAQGFFAISGDAGIEALAMANMASPYHNVALRVVLSPLLALFSAGWRRYIAYVVGKHARSK